MRVASLVTIFGPHADTSMTFSDTARSAWEQEPVPSMRLCHVAISVGVPWAVENCQLEVLPLAVALTILPAQAFHLDRDA